MPTNGSNPTLVLLSLITAFFIIVLFVVMRDNTAYTQSVGAFAQNPPKASARYRITGIASESGEGLRLCDDTYCLPLRLTPQTRQPHLAESGKRVVVFGQWSGNALEVREIITPCHVKTQP